MFLQIFLWLGRVFLKKPFIVGQGRVYEAWRAEKGVAYFYPSEFSYGKVATASSTFSDWEVARYQKGNAPSIFCCEKDAAEASKRVLKVLHDLHEELGY